jgi:hypothetical protein
MSTATITHKIQPAENDNGFVAIVTADNDTIYHSGKMHAAEGVFASDFDANEHGGAMADAYRRHPEIIEQLSAERSLLFASEYMIQHAAMVEDDKQAAKFKKHAATCASNVEARELWLGELAREAKHPRVEIVWRDRSKPGSVAVVTKASAWDRTFEPARPEGADQLSLPGVSWQLQRDGGKVVGVVGHGRLALTIVAGELVLTLGNRDHVLRGEVGSESGLWLVEVEQVPDPEVDAGDDDEPAAKSKGSATRVAHDDTAIPERSSTKDTVLRTRLEPFNGARSLAPETWLALFDIERAHKKPRKRVTTFLMDTATMHADQRLLDDMSAIDDDRRPCVFKPDYAAAQIVSASTNIGTDRFTTLILDCRDRIVLDDAVDREQERGKAARDSIIALLQQRLEELPEPEVKPKAALGLVDGEVDADDDGGCSNCHEPMDPRDLATCTFGCGKPNLCPTCNDTHECEPFEGGEPVKQDPPKLSSRRRRNVTAEIPDEPA